MRCLVKNKIIKQYAFNDQNCPLVFVLLIFIRYKNGYFAHNPWSIKRIFANNAIILPSSDRKLKHNIDYRYTLFPLQLN